MLYLTHISFFSRSHSPALQMTISSVIWSAKLNQPLIQNDSGVCVALDKALPLFCGMMKTLLDFFSFFFSRNMDKG